MKNLKLIGLCNEIGEVKKTLRIAFGTYPHKTANIDQVFGPSEAALIIGDFQKLQAVEGFRGLPVYIGHPDVKGFEDKYRDHSAYGWVIEIKVSQWTDSKGQSVQGLEMAVDWTPPGELLLANEAFAYFSPYWLSFQKNGSAHPFKIKSIGLTQEPMIQFLALACEDNEQGENMNLLERLLALLPEKVRENIKDEDGVVSFFQKMLDGFRAMREAEKKRWEASDAAFMALENEDPCAYIEALHGKITGLANELQPAKATLTQQAEELALANEELKTLRGAHSKLLLDVALQDGRITPATRTKWEGRFAEETADFMALANELGSIDPVMKTTRITKGAKPGDNGGATHADVIALANEMCKDDPSAAAFERAYARAKKDPRFAHLFQVKQADAQ